MLEWEQARFDEAVADVFGYYSLQLGMPMLPGLRANRMPHRWLALGADHEMHPSSPLITPASTPFIAPLAESGPWLAHLLAHAVALPFPDDSIDLLALPHTLEWSHDPHTALREAVRVLVPEGRLVISGLHPASLWGVQRQWARLQQRAGVGDKHKGVDWPDGLQLIAPWRLRDWLRLLGCEVEELRFGCYRPAVRSAAWLQRWAWLDGAGERFWPILGAAYFVVAVKRVPAMHLLKPTWRSAPAPERAASAVASFHPPKPDFD